MRFVFDPSPLQFKRLERGLTYRELAVKTGLAYQAVHQILHGQRRAPGGIKKLCKALHVPVSSVWVDGSRLRAT